jgi:hypothetical protein
LANQFFLVVMVCDRPKVKVSCIRWACMVNLAFLCLERTDDVILGLYNALVAVQHLQRKHGGIGYDHVLK